MDHGTFQGGDYALVLDDTFDTIYGGEYALVLNGTFGHNYEFNRSSNRTSFLHFGNVKIQSDVRWEDLLNS